MAWRSGDGGDGAASRSGAGARTVLASVTLSPV